MPADLPHLVWIDCEMTGLSLESDALIEIAVLVTDSEPNIIGEGVDLVIHATEGQIAGMNDFVRQMHTSSGLIDEIAGGANMADAEQQILLRNRERIGEPEAREGADPGRKCHGRQHRHVPVQAHDGGETRHRERHQHREELAEQAAPHLRPPQHDGDTQKRHGAADEGGA